MNLTVWSHSVPWRAGWKSVLLFALAATVGSGQTQPTSAVPATGSEWGEPVEGVSVRLESEKPVWDDHESGVIDFAVIFKAGVRNRGNSAVSVAPVEQTGELEVDGIWYKWPEPVDVKSSALAPGKELGGFPVIPDNKWRSATTALTASPGKHKFRFAIVAQRDESNHGPTLRAVSNPIEVEFLARAPQNDPVGVWFSGHVVDDVTGELMTNFAMQSGVLDPGKSAEVIWSDGPMGEPNFIGGQWSRSPELGGFWGAQNLGTRQKAWARIIARGYLNQTVSPAPVAGYADVNGLTVRMKRGVELTGVVLDHAGQPVPGTKVFLIDVPKLAVRDDLAGWWFVRGGAQFQNGTATTDASGRFAVHGDIKAAKEVVAVSADQRMVWAVTNGGATNDLKIALPEPATIIVRYDIADDEAEAQIHLQMLCGELDDAFRKAVKLDAFSRKVANHGRLALTNLTPGTYDFERLKMLSIGDPTRSPESNAGRAANRGRNILYEQRTIIVRAGEVSHVDLVRDTGFAISGQITGLDATGALGAFIYVRPAGETNDSRDVSRTGSRVYLDALTCGKEGTFQTQRLKPGTYSIVAEADSLTSQLPATSPARGIPRDPGYTGAAQVTIPNDGPPAPVKIELHRRVVVTPESELFASARSPDNTRSELFPTDHSTNNPPANTATRSGNPKPAPTGRSAASDPDNPLNLSDDTIIKLFNTGKAMAVLASLAKMDFVWNKQTPNSAQLLYGVDRNARGSGVDPFGDGDLRVGAADGKERIFSVGPDGKWDGAKLAQSDDPQLLGDLGAESDLNEDLPHHIKWLNDEPLAQYLAGGRTAHILAKHGPHSAPPPPPDGKVNYGPRVDGLRAAVELEGAEDGVMSGETIGVRFYIRNEADYDIQVRNFFWRVGDDLFVEDETGRRMNAKNVPANGDLAVQRQTLKPGEELVVGSHGLVFASENGDDDRTNYPGDYSALVAPGKYKVHFALQFGDAVTAAWSPNVTNLPEPLDWQGTLETAPVLVTVKARTAPLLGSRPDLLPDPGNPLHLPPAQVTKLFQAGSAMWKVASASHQFFARYQHPPAALEDLFAPMFPQQAKSMPFLAKGQGADPFGGGDLRIEASGHKLRICSVGPDGQWDGGKLVRPDDPKLEGDLCLEADLLDPDGASFGPRLTSPNGDLLGFYFDGRRARYLARDRAKSEGRPAPNGGNEKAPAGNPTNATVLNYGPPVEGLRTAIEFVVTNDDAVATGEPLRVRVHVRNESDRDVPVSSAWNWPKREDELNVLDEAGKKVDWTPGRLDELNSPNDVRRQIIRPGEDAVVKSGWINPALPRDIWDMALNGEIFPSQTPPAKYTMRATFHFPDEPNGGPNRAADWQGELKSGPATVKIERVLAVEISLGIRDNSRIGQYSSLTLVEYPLAFRVKNTGKTTIGANDTPGLFSGDAHLLPKGGAEVRRPVMSGWDGMVQDLPPGGALEHGLYADPVEFFKNLNDGDYQVWWTLGALKSNILHFTVKDGKAALEPNDPNAPVPPPSVSHPPNGLPGGA